MTSRALPACALGALLLVPLAARGARIALLPVDDRVGDPEAALALDVAVTGQLEALGHDLVGREAVRTAQRERRLRRLEDAPPEALTDLAASVGADVFLAVSLHQAERLLPVRLTVSGRGYDAASGELAWTGFATASGLDRRTVFGLGIVSELDALAPRIAERLLDDLASRPERRALGAIAVLPLAGLNDAEATVAAEILLEATRATLFARGAPLVSPNLVAPLLRRHRELRWGEVDAVTRDELAALGARWILTGAVETFDLGGSEEEPRPQVAVGLRLVDAESGRIAWTGFADRDGWDGLHPFGLGRTHSRPALAVEIVTRLTDRLLAELDRDPTLSPPPRTPR